MGRVELLNCSVNETLSRTLMTSVTVFVAVLALVLFGGPVLYSFSIAMLWGVIVGTYSSVWIACAALVYLTLRPQHIPPRHQTPPQPLPSSRRPLTPAATP